jgi:TonB family protein
MVAAPHPAPPPPVRTPQEPTDQIRVGGKVQAANLIKKVTPPYPPLAKQARIQGTVRFSATIGKDGTVTSLQLISGHPLLAPAAQEAVKQWIYKPTLMNGQPVQVLTQIDVNFNLEAQSTVTDLPEGVSIAPPTGPDWDPLPAFTGPFVVSLRSEIGVWDLDSAKSGLGESGMKGPFQAGAAYTYYEFASPNSPNFASAGLRFRNSNGKLLNAILAPRHRVRWERQVEVVKEKFPNEELRSIQHGANTKYISVGGRTSFEVGPDGYVLYMLIY